MCHVLAIVLSIPSYLLESSNCSLKSSVSAPACVNNDTYSETDILLLLIKAAACTIASRRQASMLSSCSIANRSSSNAFSVTRCPRSCLASA
jgi:hypothetical protein